jgi:2-oxoglutarate dehydrogenase E1 component
MTPKSLLRAEDASSRVEDFTNARFEEILDDPSVKDPKKINRVILCSGKVYYDLLKARAEDKARASAAIVRIEQLYPLNDSSLKAIFKRYPGAKDIVWCQEEPKNNGAWAFIAPLIAEISGIIPAYAGRPESASPAAGSSGKHKEQQASLLNQAFIA